MKGLGDTQSEDSGGVKGENPGSSLRGQDQMSIIAIQLSGRTEGYGPEIQEGEEKPWRISHFLLF